MISRQVISYKTFALSLILHIILITLLLLSPVTKRKGKFKEMTYRVSLSYLPVNKAETKPSVEKPTGSEGKKGPQVAANIPKVSREVKKDGMRPLKGEKKEEIPSPKEEIISLGGTKVEGLDAPYFPFNYYLNQVLSFISSNWYKPPSPEGTFCTVYFLISKSGRIIEAKVEASSGNSAFDRAALRAVLASNPLPPLPYDYYEDKLGIHLKFQ